MRDADAIKIFEDAGPTLTAQAARSHGLHWSDLYRLRDSGEVLELTRGVFRLASAPAVELLDVVAVLARAPRAIACLATSASVWELTDEIPRAVHIAVPKGAHRPRIEWPETSVHVFAADTFDVGRTSYELASGESIALYDAERTAVDLIRLAHKHANEPLGELVRRYLARSGSSPARLLETARQLNAATPVRRILEIVVS